MTRKELFLACTCMVMILILTSAHAMCGKRFPDTVYSLVDSTILDIIESKGLKIGERSMNSVINYKCYEYDDYVILVRSQLFEAEGEIHGKVGEEILVRYRDEDPKNEAMCEWPHEGEHFKIVEWAGYFDGIHDRFMVVEKGTAPFPRLMAIYDLKKKEKIYEATYRVEGPVRIDENNKLTLDKITDKRIRHLEELDPYRDICTDIDRLEDCIKHMGGVALFERVIVDLETLEEVRTGEISCGCLQ